MNWKHCILTGTLALFVSPHSYSNGIDSAAEQALKDWGVNKINEQLERKAPFISLRKIDNDGSDLDDGYAIDYDWQKVKTKAETTTYEELRNHKAEQLDTTSYQFKLFAEGSYAWDDAHNNEDLSKLGLNLSYAKASAYVIDFSEIQPEYTKCLLSINPDTQSREEIDAIGKTCTNKLKKSVQSQLHQITSFAYDAGLHVHLEGNQDFTQKQNVYGAHFGIKFTAAEQSHLNWLNLPDIPFRFLRKILFSGESNYRPSFPTITFNLDQVDPTDNDPRKVFQDGGDTFDRFNVTSAFNTNIATYENYPIVFEWIYRRYLERSASDTIKDANLDDFEFNKFSVFLPGRIFSETLNEQNFFVSFTKGKLPFDIVRNNAISIGWNTNLENLTKFLTN